MKNKQTPMDGINGPYRDDNERKRIYRYTIISIIIMSAALIGISVQNIKNEKKLQELEQQKEQLEIEQADLNGQIEQAFEEALDETICSLEVVDCFEYQYTITADLSAYNLVPEQTSGDPCIGAYGDNLCEAIADGIYPAASTILEHGTLFEWNNQIFQVMDVSGTPERLDIAFSADQIEEAIEFGVKYDQEIKILEKR